VGPRGACQFRGTCSKLDMPRRYGLPARFGWSSVILHPSLAVKGITETLLTCAGSEGAGQMVVSEFLGAAVIGGGRSGESADRTR
jgi:hypothetical protein